MIYEIVILNYMLQINSVFGKLYLVKSKEDIRASHKSKKKIFDDFNNDIPSLFGRTSKDYVLNPIKHIKPKKNRIYDLSNDLSSLVGRRAGSNDYLDFNTKSPKPTKETE